MAYTVVKTVKGRPYLYLQESVWENGRVRTHSKHIVPYNPTTGKVQPQSNEFALEEIQAEVASKIQVPFSPLPSPASFHHRGEGEKKPASSSPGIGDPSPSAGGAPGAAAGGPPPAVNREKSLSLGSAAFSPNADLGLSIELDCETYTLSRYSLEQDRRNSLLRLQRLGVGPSLVPAIYIESGWRFRTFYRRLSDRWIIRVPKPGATRYTGKHHYQKRKGKVREMEALNREHIRTTYRRTLVRCEIEALKRAQPQTYTALSLGFSQSFGITNQLLFRYLVGRKSVSGFAKALALWSFSILHPVAMGKLPAQSLGVSEYGKRKVWEDEAAALGEELLRHGGTKIRNRISASIHGLQAKIRKISQAGLLRRFWKRGELKRADLRIRLLRERLTKVDLLDRVLGIGRPGDRT